VPWGHGPVKVLTSDIKNRQLWQTAGDLMSYRLGSGLAASASRMVRQCFVSEAHRCSVVCAAWQCPCVSSAPIRATSAEWCSLPAAPLALGSVAGLHMAVLSRSAVLPGPRCHKEAHLLEQPPLSCRIVPFDSTKVPIRELAAHQAPPLPSDGSGNQRLHKVGPDCLGTSSMGTQTLETLACNCCDELPKLGSPTFPCYHFPPRKKVQDAPSQCSAPVLLPAGKRRQKPFFCEIPRGACKAMCRGVQTGYALYAPENLRSEASGPCHGHSGSVPF